MTFKAFETSARGGKPTHLFLFGRQALAWRFAQADRNVVISGKTYLAAAIQRSEIKQTIEAPQDKVTITFPYIRDPAAVELPVTQSLGDNWHPYVPSDPITVMCMATHLNDPDAEIAVEWMGVAAQPKFSDGKLELTCMPTSGADRNVGNGPKWQVSCWKTPYSTGPRGCGMNPADFESAATLSAVAGLTLTAAEFAGLPLSLAGGKVTWTRGDGLVMQRSIMAHAGNTITLLYGAADLAPGLAVAVRPSCGRTWADCAARFPDPQNHYGGAIYKPVKNPYDGQSMSW